MPTESALTGDRLPDTVLREIAINLVKETPEFQKASRRLLYDLLERVDVRRIDEHGTDALYWALIVVRGRVLVRKRTQPLKPIDTTVSRAVLRTEYLTIEYQPGAYWVDEPPLEGHRQTVRLSTRLGESAYVFAVHPDLLHESLHASAALAHSYRGLPLPPPGDDEPHTGGSGPPFDPVAPVTPMFSTGATHGATTGPLRARGVLDVSPRFRLATSVAEPPARFAASAIAAEAADATVQLPATVRRPHPGRQRRRHRRRIRLGIRPR